MSKYTTGEVAKLCSVTVRTVQYYDKRGIISPAELSEGGRRLYSEDDLRRMKIICFLRELGLPLDSISQMLCEENSREVISMLLTQQQQALKDEIGERQKKLRKLESLTSELKSLESVSVESIGDIAYIMSNKKRLRKIHITMLVSGIPLTVLQLTAIILWITAGMWQLFAIWAAAAIPWGILISRYYFKNVAYICPQCHTVFTPSFREAFFARHTPATRRLTCTNCGRLGFCVETARKDG